MAISYIGKTESSDTGNVSSLSTSVTVSSGSNRALIVCTQTRDQNAAVSVSSVVFNTTESFTVVRGDSRAGAPGWRTEIWRLLNPTVTTANVVVTWASTPSDNTAYTVIELQGVHQTTPINTSNGSSGLGTTLSASVTTTVDNTLIIDSAMGRDDGGLTADGTQTVITDRVLAGPFSDFEGAGVSRFVQASQASKTMQWTQAQVFDWAMTVAAIAPAPTGQTLAVNVGSYILTGIATIFRVGSPLYLRYRK